MPWEVEHSHRIAEAHHIRCGCSMKTYTCKDQKYDPHQDYAYTPQDHNRQFKSFRTRKVSLAFKVLIPCMTQGPQNPTCLVQALFSSAPDLTVSHENLEVPNGQDYTPHI